MGQKLTHPIQKYLYNVKKNRHTEKDKINQALQIFLGQKVDLLETKDLFKSFLIGSFS